MPFNIVVLWEKNAEGGETLWSGGWVIADYYFSEGGQCWYIRGTQDNGSYPTPELAKAAVMKRLVEPCS
jgi:hypothetical protein